MIDNIIILLLIVGAFIAGIKLADWYNQKIQAYSDYYLRLNAAEKGVGYVAPPKQMIDEEFMDTLKKYGRATKQISPDK